MHMLMTSDLTQKTICKDLKLSDIMSFEDDTRIQEYEDALCSLDMNAIIQELMATPQLRDYYSGVSRSDAVKLVFKGYFDEGTPSPILYHAMEPLMKEHLLYINVVLYIKMSLKYRFYCHNSYSKTCQLTIIQI